MATNKVLIAQAIAIAMAADLDLAEGEAELNKMNNAELAKVVKDMKKSHPDAAAKVAEDERLAAKELADAKKAKAKAKAAEAKPPYYLADGKSITTKRGLLGPGREIKAEDLAGGQKALDGFVKTKHVIKS